MAELKKCEILEDVLVDAKIEIEPRLSYYETSTPEKKAEALQEWCDDVREFFRDHRSQDANSFDVVRITRKECSACRNEWDPAQGDGSSHDFEVGKTYCANCGAEFVKAARPNCYECKFRGEIPGDCHSSCSNTHAKVVGAKHGRVNGWFYWPVNFDPIWLEKCDGFERVEKVSV